MKEIWKDIKGYEGIYQISNLGQVKSLHNKLGQKELIMKQNLKRNGYYQIRLKNNGKQKDYIVHRLVAQAFIDNPMKLPCINHIDENKTNNNVENLEWCTVEYNIAQQFCGSFKITVKGRTIVNSIFFCGKCIQIPSNNLHPVQNVPCGTFSSPLKGHMFHKMGHTVLVRQFIPGSHIYNDTRVNDMCI